MKFSSSILRHRLECAAFPAVLSAFMLGSCGDSAKEKALSAAAAVEEAPAEAEMARNDIAMTVRSIASAIEAGEKLDSAVYNFRGCLTDGRGVPLYTDFDNRPGEWLVDVASPDSAVIRSLHPGDLFPEELRIYIAGSLNLTPDDICSSGGEDDEEESAPVVYDFGPGSVYFRTHDVESPDGSESPLLSIGISRHKP